MSRAIENKKTVDQYLHANKINWFRVVGFNGERDFSASLQLIRKSIDRTREQSKSVITREVYATHDSAVGKNFTETKYFKIKLAVLMITTGQYHIQKNTVKPFGI